MQLKLSHITLAAAMLACGITAAQAAQLSGSVGMSAGQIDGFVIHQAQYGLNGDEMRLNYQSLQASAGIAQPAGPGTFLLGLAGSYSLGGTQSVQNVTGALSQQQIQDILNRMSSAANSAPAMGGQGQPVAIGARSVMARAVPAAPAAQPADSRSLSPGAVQDYSISAGYALPLSHSFVLTPGIQIGVQRVLGESYTRRVATLAASWQLAPSWDVAAAVGIGRVHGTRNALMQRGDGSYRAASLQVSYSPDAANTFSLAAGVQGTQTASLPGLGDLSMRNRSVSLSYSRTF